MRKNDFAIAHTATRTFQKKTVYFFEQISIPTHCQVVLRFEGANSEWAQGIWLGDMLNRTSTIRLIANGQIGGGVKLWQDTSPSKVEISVESPQGYIFIYNIWDKGNGQASSQTNSSGMIIEKLDDGRIKRYFCNDGHLEQTFNHLVFSIEII